ncbi:MAG: hypothetical protein H6682_00120 [Candidatus Eisenbacteria bacterium]|nr:hypothetical protein [Candidatus Eisenbacteria bacterium]
MAARPILSDSVRDVLSDGRHAWDGGEIFWVADLVKSGERVDSRREQSKRSARRHDVAEVADVVDVDTSVFASPRRLALLAGIVAIGLAYAYVLRWTSDDAFITFRYIDQWLGGHGLVYNPGERVEGYTHPLWLLLLTPFRAAGLALVPASMFLGLLSYAGLLLLLGRRYPLTALVLALHSEVATWATGGLETMLFTLETMLLVWTVSQKRAWLAGLVSVAVVLTRPDGALFVVCAGLFLLLWSERSVGMGGRIRTLGRFLAPIALVLAPYLAWKLSYYGDLLPNTYYAKSGGGSWWSQGEFYLRTVGRGHPTTWLGVVPLVACLLVLLQAAAAAILPSLRAHLPRFDLPWGLGERLRETSDEEVRRFLVAVVFAWAYLILFVARVGGDFMYARFVVPVLPLLFLSFEILLRVGWRPGAHAPRIGRRALLLGVLPLVVFAENWTTRASLFLDADSARGRRRLRGIEDERWYWASDTGRGENRIEEARRYGAYFEEQFDGMDVTVAILGQAAFGYYGRFPRVVEENGLTEPLIARRPVTERGRPGHEKRATLDDLRFLGVDFRLLRREPEELYRAAHFRVGNYALIGELVRYDAPLVSKLLTERADRVDIIEFPRYFDYWASTEAAGLTRSEVNDVAAEFEAFYFRYNDDPVRWERLRNLCGM